MRPSVSGLSILTFTLLVTGLFTIPARSQNYSGVCDGNTADVTACLIEHYKRADADLNAVYRKAVKTATENGPADLANLKAAQRKWIVYRDAVCEAEFALYHGGTAGGPAKFACLWRTTDQRTHELTEAYLFLGGASSGGQQAKGPARVFTPAVKQIQSKISIPILLPSELPSAVPANQVKLASGEVRADGYFISLYYSASLADAGYAAGFGGSTLILEDRDLPNSTRVALSNGRTGIFRPVSCGGSCAPANLWWEQNGVMYQIQITLRPDLPEKEQQNILVETANSTVPVP